uniref:Small nuclear ribonucleoprotein G n=1 Tax=Oncorhynchus tshawytscha TaxID=74940 RepID=A0A8C8CUH9_ONCTS
MDAVPCSWNTTRVQESFARTKPASDTLTKLAKLVAQKQDSQSQNQLLPDVCPCVCAQCSQGFSDMAELLHHQQGEHALLKLNGGRQVQGVLRGFDPFMNLVMDDCLEMAPGGIQNTIGMVVIRGNSIIMLEALERV